MRTLASVVGGLYLLIPTTILLPPARAQEKAASDYAGSEACQPCHEDIFKGLEKNPHHSVEVAKRKWGRKKMVWEGKACESCHGPGAKHAESVDKADIRNPGKMPPSESSQICLNCHLNQQTHVGRLESGHARNQVACSSCHSIHAVTPPPPGERTAARPSPVKNRAARINEQCASCHSNEWAAFQRPYRHKLPEAAMSCVDCHNPHGSLRRADLRLSAANEPGCYRCHSDKRGPFVYEHPPVRLDGCGICHEPHGSANPRMLNRHEVRFQCMECHSNLQSPGPSGTIGSVPPAFHDLTSRRYQNCTTCHWKVHGSQVNRALLR